MPKSLTILLITSERLVRADVRPGGRASDCRIVAQSRPAVDDLPSLVEMAIRLNARKPRRVLLLTTEAWTQTLPMAAGAAAGMPDDEVAAALAFESEPFSGISAFDSLGVCRPLPRVTDEPQFWFTQMAASQRESLEYVVGQAGGKLLGIAHPAGLPRSLHDASPARWQRVELWPDAVVCLRREGPAPIQVHIINTGPRSATWQQDARFWFDQFDPPEVQETLLATDWAGSSGWDDADTVPFDLAEESVLARWLMGWAAQAVQRHPETPILRPAPKAMPTSTRLGIAGMIGAMMLTLCVGHYRWSDAVARDAQLRIAELKQPAEELKKKQAEADDVQRQLTTLTTQTDRMQASVDACLRAMEWNRQRMAQLLSQLAASDPETLVIQAIETGRDGIRVRGVSRRPEQPNQLAARLANQLRPLGLSVGPPNKEAGFLLADGSPYLFELLIQDVSHLGQPLVESQVAGSPASSGGAAQLQETAKP
jgi:hypothetical protein